MDGVKRIGELDRLIDRNIAFDMLFYRPDELDECVRLGDPFIKATLQKERVVYGLNANNLMPMTPTNLSIKTNLPRR